MQANQGSGQDNNSLMQAALAKLKALQLGGAGNPLSIPGNQEAEAAQGMMAPPGQDPGAMFEQQAAAGLGPIENSGAVPGAHVPMAQEAMGMEPQGDLIAAALAQKNAPLRQAAQARFSGNTGKLSDDEYKMLMQVMGPGNYQVK
jgi:hypothetical protein